MLAIAIAAAMEPDALVPIRAEPQLHAGVGVDLEVYITSIARGRKEKLHAAVLVDGRERRGILGTDVRFPCALVNAERMGVIAQPLLHAHAAGRHP